MTARPDASRPARRGRLAGHGGSATTASTPSGSPGSCAETADASSFVLEVPDDLRDTFAYEAGQFCTFRVRGRRRARYLRCYSMSLGAGRRRAELAGHGQAGAGRRWCRTGMIDTLEPRATRSSATRPPASSASPRGTATLVAFAAGQRHHPGHLAREDRPRHGTDRRVRLLYANRDRDRYDLPPGDSTRSPPSSRDRFELVHHLDAERGFVGTTPPWARRSPGWRRRRPRSTSAGRRRSWTWSSTALLDQRRAATTASTSSGSPSAEPARARPTPRPTRRRHRSGHHRARRPGRDRRPPARYDRPADRPPARPDRARPRARRAAAPPAWRRSSRARSMMHVNNALTDDEVADGWVLTCQSVPDHARRCTSSTDSRRLTMDQDRPDRRHHRARAAAGPVRGRHDPGRRRGGRSRCSPPTAPTAPSATPTRWPTSPRWSPPRPRACS